MGILQEKLDVTDAPETEQVEVCPLCHESDAEFMFWNFDRLYHLPGKFGTWKCSGCGLIRLSPRPTPATIGLYYPEDYGAYAKPDISIQTVSQSSVSALRDGIRSSVLSTLGYEVGRLAFWQRLLKPVLKRFFFRQATYGYAERFPAFVPNGRALEVGCGNGAYLSYLKHHGWHVLGVDLSSIAAKTAKDLFDIDVMVGQLSEVELKSESFDYIHLSHVVEHFFDPVEELKRIAQLLKPDGRAYVEVPNSEGCGAKASGAFWYGWDPPRHFFTFSPHNLKLAAEDAGLNVEKLTTIFSDYFQWAITYEHEDATGEMLAIRPSVPAAESMRLRNLRKKASDTFARDALSGDFISCWLSKPVN
jgi:SAM-dependent methyltransferase